MLDTGNKFLINDFEIGIHPQKNIEQNIQMLCIYMVHVYEKS